MGAKVAGTRLSVSDQDILGRGHPPQNMWSSRPDPKLTSLSLDGRRIPDPLVAPGH